MLTNLLFLIGIVLGATSIVWGSIWFIDDLLKDPAYVIASHKTSLRAYPIDGHEVASNATHLVVSNATHLRIGSTKEDIFNYYNIDNISTNEVVWEWDGYEITTWFMDDTVEKISYRTKKPITFTYVKEIVFRNCPSEDYGKTVWKCGAHSSFNIAEKEMDKRFTSASLDSWWKEIEITISTVKWKKNEQAIRDTKVQRSREWRRQTMKEDLDGL